MTGKVKTRRLGWILENVQVGSAEWSWEEESDDLWDWDSAHMNTLCDSIQREGIIYPVLVGDDGRLWDGHHRVVAAMALGLSEVPIDFV